MQLLLIDHELRCPICAVRLSSTSLPYQTAVRAEHPAADCPNAAALYRADPRTGYAERLTSEKEVIH